MKKFVINKCYGGFGLSQKALKWLIDNKNWLVFKGWDGIKDEDRRLGIVDTSGSSEPNFFGRYSVVNDNNLDDDYHKSRLIFRSHPDIIECVETIGLKKSSDTYADLIIVNVPEEYSLDDLEIDEYDGVETLQTKPIRF